MTPTQIVHKICGERRVDGCISAIGKASCYVCGGFVERGIRTSQWMPDTFTDQTRVALPASLFVCESCCYVMSRTSTVPGRPPKDGKAFGGNFRNYSTLWEPEWNAPAFGDDGTKVTGYANASKGQKQIIRSFLERDHEAEWFAAIADSGQKHVLPYATINPPGRSGIVLFDERRVTVPSDVSLVAVLCQLLTDGVTKEELERGDYRPITWQRIGADRLRSFEYSHGQTRGNWFALALWLAQRDENEVSARLEREKVEKESAKSASKKRGNAPGKRANRKRCNVQRSDDEGMQRASADELLGANHEPAPGSSANKRNSGGVDHVSTARTKDNRSWQLRLFCD